MGTYPCRQHADCEVIFRTFKPNAEKGEKDKSDKDDSENVQTVCKGKHTIMR